MAQSDRISEQRKNKCIILTSLTSRQEHGISLTSSSRKEPEIVLTSVGGFQPFAEIKNKHAYRLLWIRNSWRSPWQKNECTHINENFSIFVSTKNKVSSSIYFFSQLYLFYFIKAKTVVLS